MTKDPLYKTWNSLRGRILDQSNKDYSNYGGRGLVMEDDWKEDFQIFRRWIHASLGPRPEGQQLDRINNSLGYLKGNLRWASTVQQQNNRRSNRMITLHGTSRTMKEWCVLLKLNYGAVKMRLGALGWGVEDALLIPTDGSQRRKRNVDQHNIYRRCKQCASNIAKT